MQARWYYGSAGPKVDLVCSVDIKSKSGHVASCTNFAKHLGDAYIQSGEIAQRLAENPKRLPGGPSDLINISVFEASDIGKIV